MKREITTSYKIREGLTDTEDKKHTVKVKEKIFRQSSEAERAWYPIFQHKLQKMHHRYFYQEVRWEKEDEV